MSLITRGESGKILIMVLVLLVVGVLLLTPLLGLMSTGLTAGQVYEKKMAALYACDAGIDDAIWKLVYTFEGLGDEPYQLDRQVNGMDVSVEKIHEREEEEGVIVYTVRSTATRDGELAAEVVAELRVRPMPFVEGSSPGEWKAMPTYVDVLTTTGPQTIAVGIPHGHGTASFIPAGSPEEVAFGKNDLLGIDLADPGAWIYFACEDYHIKDSDTIGDAHRFVNREGHEFIMMAFEASNTKVGTNRLSINPGQARDIVVLHIDQDSLLTGQAELFVEDLGQYFCGGIEIEALGRMEYGDGRDDASRGSILFAIDKTATLLSPHSGSFLPNQVVRLDLGDVDDPDYPEPTSFELYLDTVTILSEKNDPDKIPGIVALSPLPAWTWGGEEYPDGRLLLAFGTQPNDILYGSDGKKIQTGDIAIWTPEDWQYDEGDDGEWVITNYGEPHSLDHPGTITLHIDLNGGDWFTMIFIDLKIISWTVEG